MSDDAGDEEGEREERHFRPGDQLEQFRIEEKIGQGGMGVVFRATDEHLRRTVALKVLPPSSADDKERRHRFLREARSAAAVTHANIAAVYEVGEVDGRVFIAMEYVEGKTLRRHLLDSPIDIPAALRITRRIARGLAKAHERGVIHRDLKPDNVMIGEDLDVKVLDFGLAKVLDVSGPTTTLDNAPETLSETTQAGRILGTPGYMSPEQARGGSIDRRTDLFSLGVMLYEMVTRARPFTGDSMMDVIIAISRDDPEPPSKLNPAVSPELERVILMLLAKKPEARFASAKELISALDALDPSRGSQTPERSSILQAPLAPPPSSKVKPRLHWQSLGMAVVGTAAVGLAIAGVAFLLVHHRTLAAEALADAGVASGAANALTDMPPPASKSPAAVTAYQQALQAYRSDDMAGSTTKLEQALELDPSLTPALLRLSLQLIQLQPTKAREAFQTALNDRAQLTPRDQALLHSVEPYVQGQPANFKEMAARLEEATHTYANDSELWFRLSYARGIMGNNAGALAAIDQATALDPGFARAWDYKAALEMQLPSNGGDLSTALAMAATCLEHSPGSPGCLSLDAEIQAYAGKCADMADTARRLIAAAPVSFEGYAWLADALYARGSHLETAREAMAQANARRSAKDRKAAESDSNLRLALLGGDFATAERVAREREAQSGESTDLDAHAIPARALLSIYLESGRPLEAGRVAADFLKRKEAWTSRATPDIWSIDADPTPQMLHVAYRQGLMTPEAFEAQRTAWVHGWEQRVATRWLGGVWRNGYASIAETPAEAKAALALAPDRALLKAFMRKSMGAADIGQTYFMAGQLDEAQPYLAKVVQSCVALDWPMEHTHAALTYGKLLEAKGDKDGACGAYRVVLERWGEAKPRSVTANEARERAKALKCPAR